MPRLCNLLEIFVTVGKERAHAQRAVPRQSACAPLSHYHSVGVPECSIARSDSVGGCNEMCVHCLQCLLDVCRKSAREMVKQLVYNRFYLSLSILPMPITEVTCVRVRVCMCVCVFRNTCIQSCIYTHIYICICAYNAFILCTFACMRMCSNKRNTNVVRNHITRSHAPLPVKAKSICPL